MTDSTNIDTHQNPLLFYDGLCGLCNQSVRWVLRYDNKEHFRFATLQGEIAEKWLSDEQRENLDSIVLVSNNRVLTQSTAVFEITRHLSGWPRLLRFFSGLPKGLTNAVYHFIARNRYRWFGKLETCPMPDEKVRNRFLDQF